MRATARSGFSDDFDDGEALLAAADERGLEGVVAKRPSSRYASGKRTRDWLKIKLRHDEEFVIAGYTRGTGHRADTFGALVLGVNEPGGCATSATSAPASATRRSPGCSSC